MKHILLSTILITVFVLSACDQTSDTNSPVASTPAPASIIDRQAGDNNSPLGFGDAVTDERLSDRANLSDMDVLLWYRLILAANKDISDRQKKAAENAIAEANARRERILASDLSPDRKAAMLQAEHDALMKLINSMFTREQLANALALKAKLGQDRRDKLSREEELRIQRQVEIWAKQMTLTERQKAAITQILKNQALQIQALRQRYANDPVALRRAMQLLQQQTDAEIYKLLTDAQKIIWKRLHSDVVRRLSTGSLGG